MLDGLRLGNFQSFAAPADFYFSKLNLIYGANSSGKSSLFRALKFLSHNLDSDFESLVSEMWDFNGEGYELQNFETAVNGQDKSKTMHFGASFQVKLRHVVPKTTNPRSSGAQKPQFNKYQFQVELKLENPGLLERVQISVSPFLSPTSGELTSGFSIGFVRRQSEQGLGKIWDFAFPENKFGSLSQILELNSLVVAHKDGILALRAGHKFGLDGIDSSLIEQNASLLFSEMSLGEQKLLEDNAICSPSDLALKISSRDLSKTLATHAAIYGEVNKFVAYAWGQFASAFKPIQHVEPLREIPSLIINEVDGYLSDQNYDLPGFMELDFSSAKKWFSKLTGGEYSFEINELEGAGRPTGIFSLNVVHGDVRTSFKNVGVGLSQVLPVLLGIFPTKLNRIPKLVLLEQPELHLHPKMQGDLADALIDATRQKMIGSQIFAETHSENLILRVLRRLRESQILGTETENDFSTNDLSLIYVDKSSNGSVARHLDIGSDGEMLDSWPIDFVDLRLDDIL